MASEGLDAAAAQRRAAVEQAERELDAAAQRRAAVEQAERELAAADEHVMIVHEEPAEPRHRKSYYYDLGRFIEGHNAFPELSKRTIYTAFPTWFIALSMALPLVAFCFGVATIENMRRWWWPIALVFIVLGINALFEHQYVLAPDDAEGASRLQIRSLLSWRYSRSIKLSDIATIEIIYNCLCDKMCLRTLCDMNIDFGVRLTLTDAGYWRARDEAGWLFSSSVGRSHELWFWTHSEFQRFLSDVGLDRADLCSSNT